MLRIIKLGPRIEMYTFTFGFIGFYLLFLTKCRIVSNREINKNVEQTSPLSIYLQVFVGFYEAGHESRTKRILGTKV